VLPAGLHHGAAVGFARGFSRRWPTTGYSPKGISEASPPPPKVDRKSPLKVLLPKGIVWTFPRSAAHMFVINNHPEAANLASTSVLYSQGAGAGACVTISMICAALFSHLDLPRREHATGIWVPRASG